MPTYSHATTAEISPFLNGFIHLVNVCITGSDGDEAGESGELEEADHVWLEMASGKG